MQPPAKRRRLERCTTLESAAEGGKGHFPRVTALELSRVVNGKTLVQWVCCEKRLKRAENNKLGGLDWRRLGRELSPDWLCEQPHGSPPA